MKCLSIFDGKYLVENLASSEYLSPQNPVAHQPLQTKQYKGQHQHINIMTSTPPLDDWESVGNEEHLDVKELKSQIYDLKQKLTWQMLENQHLSKTRRISNLSLMIHRRKYQY